MKRWAATTRLLSANGGKTYSKPEADRALALTIEFFKHHLAGDVV